MCQKFIYLILIYLHVILIFLVVYICTLLFFQAVKRSHDAVILISCEHRGLILVQRSLKSRHMRLIGAVLHFTWKYPADNYMFKVNNRNTRTRYEICSKLTIMTPKRRHWRLSSFFIVNFKYISHLVLVFLLLILSS